MASNLGVLKFPASLVDGMRVRGYQHLIFDRHTMHMELLVVFVIGWTHGLCKADLWQLLWYPHIMWPVAQIIG